MQKAYQTIASIVSETNRAVSTSDENWNSIRENSYIRFGDDPGFYTVGKVRSFFFIKDFNIRGNRVLINDNIGLNLSVHDCLQISYKEYELLTIISPKDGGSRYKVGESISIDGGQLSPNNNTGFKNAASFKVIQVDESGRILQVALEERGKYTVAPGRICKVAGGSGSGAEFECEFKVTDNRTLVDKTITDIERLPGQTVLVLDSGFPEGVLEGKLSVEKWEILLTSSYTGETKNSQPCEITRDFTPYLGLPLTMRGSINPESVYNLAINILDNKMAEFDKRLSVIETKINKLLGQ
jgi:hypothetical protein